MNWYKKANKENFPVWLAKQLTKETVNFQHIKSRIYPGDTFENRDIQLVEDWIGETNPDFENMSIYEAIKAARIHYENKKIPPKLTPKDINMHNLTIALLDGYTNFRGSALLDRDRVITDSIVVKSIKAVYPDVSKLKITNVFNYTVTVEFDTEKVGSSETSRKFARLVTKDGKYFSISQIGKAEDEPFGLFGKKV